MRQGGRSLVDQNLVALAGLAAQRVGQRGLRREPFPLAPFRPQGARRAHHIPFVLADHREQVLDANHPRIGEPRDRGRVDGNELGADRGRPDHARMQHSRQLEVVHVDVVAHHFGRHVRSRQRLADDCIGRGILDRRLGIELEVELAAADQLGKADAGAAGLRPHLPIGGDEVIRPHVEPAGSELDQPLACGCRRLPDLDAAALDAVRSGGAALIRRQRGVAFDEADLVDTDAELLGGDLRNGDAQTLAEIDLAAEYRHGAVAVDGEEGVDLLGVEHTGGGGALRGSFHRQACERKPDREGAGLEETAAGQTRRVDRSVHVSLPVRTPPAPPAPRERACRSGTGFHRAPRGSRSR